MSFTTRQGGGGEFYAQRLGYLRGFSFWRLNSPKMILKSVFVVVVVVVVAVVVVTWFVKWFFVKNNFHSLWTVVFEKRNPQDDTGLVVEHPDANGDPKVVFMSGRGDVQPSWVLTAENQF